MSAREGRTVLLCGSDACFSRMLAFELRRAGFLIADDSHPDGAQPDCAVVDLDSAAIPAGLPAVGYTRRGNTAPDGTPVLVRPFAIPTLLDILAQLDRPDLACASLVGGLRLDDDTRTVTHGGVRLALMPGEYALLSRLLDTPGEPVSRAALIAALPSGSAPTSNLAEVTICTLRRKLEASFGLRPIRTVRGVGYKYEV